MGFKITCYGQTTEYKESERPKQLKEYEELIYMSEGCERDRYVSVFFGIINLCKNVDDQWAWKFGQPIDL